MRNKNEIPHELKKEYDSLDIFIRDCDFNKMATSFTNIAAHLSKLEYYYEASVYFGLANHLKNN